MAYYHSYAIIRSRGEETPMHQDMSTEAARRGRRLWSFYYFFDRAERNFELYTDELAHVGTFQPEPNSALLFPAQLHHVDRLSIDAQGPSLAVGIRLAACSRREAGVDPDLGDLGIDICYP